MAEKSKKTKKEEEEVARDERPDQSMIKLAEIEKMFEKFFG